MEQLYLSTYQDNLTQARAEIQNFVNWEVEESLKTANLLINKLFTLETIKINKQCFFKGA